MLKPLLTATVLFVAATSAFAAPPASKTKPAAKAAALVCPVTGEKIASVKDAAGSSTYQGKTYYFCCSSCKPTFDKDPAKYVKTASAAPKAGAAKKS